MLNELTLTDLWEAKYTLYYEMIKGKLTTSALMLKASFGVVIKVQAMLLNIFSSFIKSATCRRNQAEE